MRRRGGRGELLRSLAARGGELVLQPPHGGPVLRGGVGALAKRRERDELEPGRLARARLGKRFLHGGAPLPRVAERIGDPALEDE